MCGSWYFPKFLLSAGSFTWIYIASLMFLVTLCDSLSTMVKHSGLTRCPVELLWWWIGDGALRYSLSLFPKVLPDSPIYSSGQLIHGHLNLEMTPLFSILLSVSLGDMRRVFMVLVPLKCTWIPIFLHDQTSAQRGRTAPSQNQPHTRGRKSHQRTWGWTFLGGTHSRQEVTIAVMDREGHTDKDLSLLAVSNTYNRITKDPTNKLKNKPAQTLRDIKEDSVTTVTGKCIPSVQFPQSLWLSQNTQIWHPLRPIVSSRGSITQGVAKELVNLKTSNISCNTSKR